MDSDGDGQLSFEEFKVLFDNADKRRNNSVTEMPLLQTKSKVVNNVIKMLRTKNVN